RDGRKPADRAAVPPSCQVPRSAALQCGQPQAVSTFCDSERARRRLRSCITSGMKLPRVVTLFGPAFDRACADLMRLVEADYAQTLCSGPRPGGLSVPQAMAAAARSDIPVLPLTCRRSTTAAKSRLPLLRTILGALPRQVVDLLRQMEHRFVALGQMDH